MSISPINQSLTQADELCNYIPVLSTLSNSVDILLKATFLNVLGDRFVRENHYWRHLDQKSYSECLTLALPLGFLFIKNPTVKMREKINSTPMQTSNIQTNYLTESAPLPGFFSDVSGSDKDYSVAEVDLFTNVSDQSAIAFISSTTKYQFKFNFLNYWKEFSYSLLNRQEEGEGYGPALALYKNQNVVFNTLSRIVNAHHLYLTSKKVATTFTLCNLIEVKVGDQFKKFLATASVGNNTLIVLKKNNIQYLDNQNSTDSQLGKPGLRVTYDLREVEKGDKVFALSPEITNFLSKYEYLPILMDPYNVENNFYDKIKASVLSKQAIVSSDKDFELLKHQLNHHLNFFFFKVG